MLGEGIGRLGCDFGQEGVFAEEIADEQGLFAFVGEVVFCNLLPQAVRDVSGEHQLCRGRSFVLGVDSASADIICYISINARQYTASLTCACIFSIPWWALCRLQGYSQGVLGECRHGFP